MAGTSKGICDRRCQSFYEEVLRKENSIRIKWFLKNQQRLLDNLEKGDTSIKREITFQQDQPQKPRTSTIIRIKPLPAWRPINSDGSIDTSIMKPVDPKVRAILYEKGVESFITMKNYFTERLKESPENRFYFPDCTSWIHGWRLNDHPRVLPSKFGKKSLLQSGFYSKVSCLQRDPDWYHKFHSGNVTNFTDFSI